VVQAVSDEVEYHHITLLQVALHDVANLGVREENKSSSSSADADGQ
jgi:hypothetical protein